MVTGLLILFALSLAICCYAYFTKKHDYWKKRNIRHDPPIPLFGNHLDNHLGKKSLVTITQEQYNKYPDEKVVGYYRGTTPVLIMRDLDIVRQILTVDFLSFYVRGLGRNVKKEPLLMNLVHVEGDMWRLQRQRLSTALTSAKLKAMFPLVVRCAEKLQGVVKADKVCDARDLMARFATEFIGACGFGIEMDTINNENSQFRKLGRLIFARSLKDRILIALTELFPALKHHFTIGRRSIEEAIFSIVENIRKQRNYKPCGRHDFIDVLLELEAEGKITGESIEKQNPDGSPVIVEMDFDLKCMAAQVFIFFAGGFETTSAATSFCLHELAYYPEVQIKVQEEIDRIMTKYNNKLCYDAILEMTYLDQTYKEALRMFPSIGNILRVCTKRYEISKLHTFIDPGVMIMIPIQAIHMDEKYYDNPEEFRPERFIPEEIKKRPKYAYLPFGYGPRNCIGAKLGLMQSLAGLAAVLHRYTVEPAPGSRRQLEINTWANVVQGVKGVPVLFRARKGKFGTK